MLFIIFKFFDSNNDGYLTRDDVHTTFTRMEVEHSIEDVERLIDFALRDRGAVRGEEELRVHLAVTINL